MTKISLVVGRYQTEAHGKFSDTAEVLNPMTSLWAPLCETILENSLLLAPRAEPACVLTLGNVGSMLSRDLCSEAE
jgi:hypothetical protein